ncbi:MAG: choice-of-anchor J domain-containing protein, partial [Bacteroidales bacterium]|nr:choice-of-anchor J domain-containing protein [Bacteroidales bacterium]
MKKKLLTIILVFVAFSMNAQLTEGFEGGVFPDGWTLESVDHEWTVSNSTSIGANTGDFFIGSFYSPATSAKDDWFFTPGLSMESGTTYPITFYVKGEGWGGVTESIELMVGTGAASADMTDQLWDSPSTAYVDWTLVTVDYVCVTTGTYFFGWHSYSAADLDYIAIDDIAIPADIVKY